MIPISLLVAHWVGDWLLQNDRMALNKSKDNLVLLEHVAVYSLVLWLWAVYWWWTPFFLAGVKAEIIFSFWAITVVTHFLTDWITSRISSRLWFFKPNFPEHDVNEWSYVEGKRHWFFVMIGFDQLIHYVTLAWTLRILS